MRLSPKWLCQQFYHACFTEETMVCFSFSVRNNNPARQRIRDIPPPTLIFQSDWEATNYYASTNNS